MAATFPTPSTVIGLGGSSITTKPFSSCTLFLSDFLNNLNQTYIHMNNVNCNFSWFFSLSKTNIKRQEPSKTRRGIGRKSHLVGHSLFSSHTNNKDNSQIYHILCFVFLKYHENAYNPKVSQVMLGTNKACFWGIFLRKKLFCVKSFERNWLRRDLNVVGFGLIGWLAPSSIPAINGKSLTGLFFDSIGTELAHFPTPPAVTSQFWLWLVTWHLGLFLCLTFGQIGFKGRTEDYF